MYIYGYTKIDGNKYRSNSRGQVRPSAGEYKYIDITTVYRLPHEICQVRDILLKTKINFCEKRSDFIVWS